MIPPSGMVSNLPPAAALSRLTLHRDRRYGVTDASTSTKRSIPSPIFLGGMYFCLRWGERTVVASRGRHRQGHRVSTDRPQTTRFNILGCDCTPLEFFCFDLYHASMPPAPRDSAHRVQVARQPRSITYRSLLSAVHRPSARCSLA
jgi:hypothetical protein